MQPIECLFCDFLVLRLMFGVRNINAGRSLAQVHAGYMRLIWNMVDFKHSEPISYIKSSLSLYISDLA